MRARVLLLFLDGVGIGTTDPDINPFFRADLPNLVELCGGRLPSLDEPATLGPEGRAFPLDATLGVEGTPQSGTGQAALLTGESAAELYGRHFGPWTPVRLRPLVEERSMLRRAVQAGRSAAFANAYPKGWPGARGGRRIAGPPLAARGAGLLTRHEQELGRGEAVSSEIVNDGWKKHLGHEWLPEVTPERAGEHLGCIANTHDLTLYAHYATDTAGHRGAMRGAVAALERVDSFLAGVRRSIADDVLLLLASDHGNIEDVGVGHTRNPVLGIAAGPGADEAAGLTDVRSVCDFVTSRIGVKKGTARPTTQGR